MKCNFNTNRKSDYIQGKVFSFHIIRNIIKKARFLTHFYSYVHLKYVQKNTNTALGVHRGGAGKDDRRGARRAVPQTASTGPTMTPHCWPHPFRASKRFHQFRNQCQMLWKTNLGQSFLSGILQPSVFTGFATKLPAPFLHDYVL